MSAQGRGQPGDLLQLEEVRQPAADATAEADREREQQAEADRRWNRGSRLFPLLAHRVIRCAAAIRPESGLKPTFRGVRSTGRRSEMSSARSGPMTAQERCAGAGSSPGPALGAR